MEILRVIDAKCVDVGIEYFVIGGHAVNAYGVARQTGDLDLGIREKDEEWWRAILITMGFVVRYERKGFVLFSPSKTEVWPIDLLCLNEKTFAGLSAESKRVSFGEVTVKIPSVRHLIAMKLHALRENWADRELKDLQDIRELVRATGFNVDSNEFKELCLRFGNEKIYERIIQLCKSV